jgi:hypothetical protein
MARFGGVEPALPSQGPPPTLRRPEQPAAAATEAAPVPALQHMTKERPRPPMRRLPKRPDSEMRQDRMKKASGKVDVCSQTSTSTLEGEALPAVVRSRVQSCGVSRGADGVVGGGGRSAVDDDPDCGADRQVDKLRDHVHADQPNQVQELHRTSLSLSRPLFLFSLQCTTAGLRVGARQVYSLLVRRGDESHTVVHRYSEFLELHKSVPSSSAPTTLPEIIFYS